MNVSLEEVRLSIAKELATGTAALRAGNEGMARVCARRAAGAAVLFWVRQNPRDWRSDIMGALTAVSVDHSFPSPVRDACRRLTARITVNFESPFQTNPLEDSSIVINHFLGDDHEH